MNSYKKLTLALLSAVLVSFLLSSPTQAQQVQVPDQVLKTVGYIDLAPVSWANQGVARAGGRLALWWIPVSQDLVMKGVVAPIAEMREKPLSSGAKVLTWPLWVSAVGLQSLGKVLGDAYDDVSK